MHKIVNEAPRGREVLLESGNTVFVPARSSISADLSAKDLETLPTEGAFRVVALVPEPPPAPARPSQVEEAEAGTTNYPKKKG